MNPFSLETFHDVSSGMDFREPLGRLLNEFRLGKIADRARLLEETAIRTHLGEHIQAWDTVFPEFPKYSEKRRTLLRVFKRERKDTYIRRLVVDALTSLDTENHVIVNPATVEGRQARYLARDLPQFEIIGTDIDPRWEALYRRVCMRSQRNFRFVQESVFEPDLERRPVAVVFFGACGSVSDGAIDYGIEIEAPFLIFRTCCHENISGNDEIVRKWSMINRYFAMKNWQFSKYRRRNSGFYFTDKYNQDAYPRSKAGRDLADSETFLRVARNAVDSDICISIIDLDRAICLQEQGYDVMWREEIFFAHRRGGTVVDSERADDLS
ncbi:MAG: hypothetical protein KAY32_11620 [Candidatus Eisenbacteria sp.]|nr:hypothetical protein [Candidatus Eisenbacteria bacterium]